MDNTSSCCGKEISGNRCPQCLTRWTADDLAQNQRDVKHNPFDLTSQVAPG